MEATINSPLGQLRLCVDSYDRLESIELNAASEVSRTKITPGLQKTVSQLTSYFNDPRYLFDIPIILHGTEMQRKIWSALKNIPCGNTISYGELASRLGTHARVIGNACRCNPLPIVIPCHRVIAKHGLGGYAGAKNGELFAIKTWLLQHESQRT